MLEEFEKYLSYEITDALIEMKIQGLIQIVLKKIEKSGEACPIKYISKLVYICNKQKVPMEDYLPILLDFFENKTQLYMHESLVEFYPRTLDKYELSSLARLFGSIKEKSLIPILHKHLSALENDPLVRINLAKSLNKLAINFMVPIPYQQKEFRIS